MNAACRSSLDDPVEAGRVRIVKLIFLIYWLLIFEGALRKWVLPEFQREIYFIRDPVALIVYWMALRQRLFKQWTMILSITAVIAWLCVLEAVFHAVDGRCDLLLTAFGLRSYFFYIPMALVIAETFDRTDLERLVRHTLLLSVPIAVISIYQSVEPASAIINVGISDNPANQVHPLGVVGGIVRTAGTFTSNEGQALFVCSVLAMLLWVWMLPANTRPVGKMTLLVATGAELANVAASGQRTIFVIGAIIICTALIAGMLMRTRGSSWSVIRACAILLVVGVVLGPRLFPRQLHALAERSAQAAEGDAWYNYGIVGRALRDFVTFGSSVSSAPLIGYGIGETSNAGNILHRTFTGWVENDWQRHVVELGPVLGIILMILRIALVVWLGANACRATRITNDALGLLLFGFIGVVLLYGQITGQGSVNGYAWLFAGLCIVASSTAGDEAFL